MLLNKRKNRRVGDPEENPVDIKIISATTPLNIFLVMDHDLERISSIAWPLSPLKSPLWEKGMMEQLLVACKGKVIKAAQKMGISKYKDVPLSDRKLPSDKNKYSSW